MRDTRDDQDPDSIHHNDEYNPNPVELVNRESYNNVLQLSRPNSQREQR